MSGISQILTSAYEFLGGLSLDVSLYIAWGAYAVIFFAALVLTLCNEGMRRADKRAFLSFTNAFTAVTLALMLTEKPFSLSVLTAVVFWVVGYILYWLLAGVSKRRVVKKQLPSVAEVAAGTSHYSAPIPKTQTVKENVRLDHALSVTEKLLCAELGRGDRQEAMRIRTTLSVLQTKPALTPEENDILNDNFNTLLKLMAKYNV